MCRLGPGCILVALKVNLHFCLQQDKGKNPTFKTPQLHFQLKEGVHCPPNMLNPGTVGSILGQDVISL